MFKVGDKVRVAQKATPENTKRVPGAFENIWYDGGMNPFLGNEYTIRSVDRLGIRFEENYDYGFPPAMLTLVSEIEKEEEKAINFQVGQTVYCLLFGKGEVVHVHDGEDFPVGVKYLNGRITEYTKRGKLFKTSSRTLFFSEPKVQAAEEPPFEPTLVGKEILITAENGSLAVVTVHKETKDKIYITPEATRFYQKKDIRTIHILEQVSI